MIDARDYLSSFQKAEARIEIKQRQLKDLQDRLTCITAPMDKELVSHTRNVGAMADTVSLIIDLEHELEEQTVEYIRRKREAYQLLEQITPEKSVYLIEHYIEGKTLAEIGRTHHIEKRWVKRRVASAMVDFQLVLDQHMSQI